MAAVNVSDVVEQMDVTAPSAPYLKEFQTQILLRGES
jgi:hypothetical protein